MTAPRALLGALGLRLLGVLDRWDKRRDLKRQRAEAQWS